VQKIHAATLHIIEHVGVRFPSKRALEIWEANGATVDREKMIVRAKPQLIEAALKKAPSAYSLGARDPAQDCPLDGNHVFAGTDGCGVEIIDIETGKRRISKLSDVRDIARVADATEEVGFHWVPLSAQDTPVETRGLHEIKAIWENSTKHVQTESIYNETEARAAIEMAALIVGGKDKLRQRPVLSVMQCTAPPLGHDGGSLDAALVAAEYGLPTGFMTMSSCLTTGPATLAGTHRKISCSARQPTCFRTSTTSRSQWVHSPPAPRSPTGRQALRTRFPPSWQALSCLTCCWGLASCMAAASGRMPR